MKYKEYKKDIIERELNILENRYKDIGFTKKISNRIHKLYKNLDKLK